jgi:hypothetical protein
VRIAEEDSSYSLETHVSRAGRRQTLSNLGRHCLGHKSLMIEASCYHETRLCNLMLQLVD